MDDSPLRLATLAFAVLSIPLVWAPPKGALFAKEDADSGKGNDSKDTRAKLEGLEARVPPRVWKAIFGLAAVGHTTFNLLVFAKYGKGWQAFVNEPTRLDDVLALLCMAGAILLRRWSYATLGRFFTYKCAFPIAYRRRD